MRADEYAHTIMVREAEINRARIKRVIVRLEHACAVQSTIDWKLASEIATLADIAESIFSKLEEDEDPAVKLAFSLCDNPSILEQLHAAVVK